MLKKFPLKRVVIISIIILSYVVFLKLLGMTCIFKNMFGVSCPGCGMTRACISALTFNFKQAFYYHPLWIALIPTVLLLIYFYLKEHKKLFKITIIISLCLLIGVYIIRLIFGDHNIVYIDFTKGYIYSWFQSFTN